MKLSWRSLISVGALVLTGSLACTSALPSPSQPATDLPASELSATSQGDAPKIAPPQAVLRWQATQEKQTYGYLVYRSESREGPFLRVGTTIVRAKGGEAVHSYEFIDDDVLPGNTYFYYLDQISLNGIKSRFSGVLAKVVEAGERQP